MLPYPAAVSIVLSFIAHFCAIFSGNVPSDELLNLAEETQIIKQCELHKCAEIQQPELESSLIESDDICRSTTSRTTRNVVKNQFSIFKLKQ